ncbi:MAG: hypothetical protein ACK56W_13130 [Pirellula sp.]
MVSIHEAIQFQSAVALASERLIGNFASIQMLGEFQSAFALASERYSRTSPERTYWKFQSAFALASER